MVCGFCYFTGYHRVPILGKNLCTTKEIFSSTE